MIKLVMFLTIAVALTAVCPVWSQTGAKQERKVYVPGGDVTPPKLLSKTAPDYTQEAKDARIEGPVILKITVTAEGRADDIEVVKSLDPGLDLKAMDAITKWEFEPGTKDGKPVAVKANIEVNFRLK
jgi:protein TonB